MKIEYFTILREARQPSGAYRRITEYESPVHKEDHGQAMIAEVGSYREQGMFVRLHSWDTNCEHAELTHLINKRIRVTVEVLDEDPDNRG
jgi:hypothetical protein